VENSEAATVLTILLAMFYIVGILLFVLGFRNRDSGNRDSVMRYHVMDGQPVGADGDEQT